MGFLLYSFTKSRLSVKLFFWEHTLILEATVGPVLSEGDRDGTVQGKGTGLAGGDPHWTSGSSKLGFSL